ncbi:MAG: type II toxin-antitoxin system HicA family toxin [Ignavibacteriales bacterium]|nr:type II toxin-antitoxin system HicA family toxin [Ignavibacteriales bacterium]
MKVRDIIKIIENDGWFLVRQKGSHKQFKHPIKKGLVTISSHNYQMMFYLKHLIVF